jgi:outer membrane protein assembly factor BamB
MKTYLLLIPLISSLHLIAADWPHWLGPNGDGISLETDWKHEINDPIWKAKVGVGFSAVSVANDKLYTMGHDGKKSAGQETVYCLDAQTGKSIWKQSYPAPLVDYLHEGGPCSTPTVDGSIVYAISKHGLLHAYQAKDGKIHLEKRHDERSGYETPPRMGLCRFSLYLG